MNDLNIRHLLARIEEQLGWGVASNWQTKDFEKLSLLIFEKTKVSLSASTLRRIWGKVNYNHQPSAKTLDTLAQFIGYDDWRAFNRQQQPQTPEPLPVTMPVNQDSKKRWILRRSAVVLVTIAIIILTIAYRKNQTGTAPVSGDYSFSSRLVTRDLPNSVVFNYDARPALTDSVFIQQSWDDRGRVLVRKDRHQFTSIYYRPGFYEAKLAVGHQVVKEHPLVIPSHGWLGLIAQEPVPVYLDSSEFNNQTELKVSASTIVDKNVAIGPKAPVVEFYNVGNFKPVPLSDFSFSVELKNNYNEGAARCQMTKVMLMTDNVPVYIPLSAPGCISELTMLNGLTKVSGKSTDLSGFGVDLSQWVKISCLSTDTTIQYRINDGLVFESKQPDHRINIIGIGFTFQGAGIVKKVALSSEGKSVFNDF